MSTFTPSPIPSEDVNAGDVATAASIQFKRTSQALRGAAGTIGSRRVLTADTFISSTDTHVLVDTTGGAVSLRLYRVSEYPSARTYIERVAGANTCTITCRGSDTIDGSASSAVVKALLIGPYKVNTFHVFNVSA